MQRISLSEIAARPIPIDVEWEDGSKETIQLPLLGCDDFQGMLDAHTERRRAAGRKAIDGMKGMTANEKYYILSQNETDEATIPDIGPDLLKPKGIRFILTVSMERAGLDPAKQVRLFKILPTYMQNNLARELSTMFPSERTAPTPTPTTPPPAFGKADGKGEGKTAPLTESQSGDGADASAGVTTG